MDNYSFEICQRAYRPSTYVPLRRCSLARAFVRGRASESTIIGLIIPESATGIVTTFDICRFQGVTALALTTLWKPWVFFIN
jgi:ribosomal protein S14